MQLRNDFKDAFVEKHGVKLGFMSAFVKVSSSFLSPVNPVVLILMIIVSGCCNWASRGAISECCN